MLVSGATAAATYLGVSEAVIGLTIVSAGTSMPELITSLVAALRGRTDLAIGNVVGSCLLNLLLVLGRRSPGRRWPWLGGQPRIDSGRSCP